MTPAAYPLRVLIVEDEPLIRWSIAETLSQKGHTVIEAGSATAAVRMLDESRRAVDVALLDCRLPDSRDLELLTRIRRMRPEAAVVMMTACGTPEMTARALDLGAYRVLDKPFDMQRLASLVTEAYCAHSAGRGHANRNGG